MSIRSHSLRIPLAALGAAALAAFGAAAPAGANEAKPAPGFTSDVSTVQVISALVGGKNVYIPSTIVVTDGGPRTLSVFNTTEMPHGFAISALGIEKVLPPGEEVKIELPKLEGGQVLQIHCQLHPAHRTGTLVVLPAR